MGDHIPLDQIEARLVEFFHRDFLRLLGSFRCAYINLFQAPLKNSPFKLLFKRWNKVLNNIDCCGSLIQCVCSSSSRFRNHPWISINWMSARTSRVRDRSQKWSIFSFTFRKADKYDLSVVKQYEFRNAVEKVLNIKMTEKQWHELIQAAKPDSDGLIDYNAFMEIFNSQ